VAAGCCARAATATPTPAVLARACGGVDGMAKQLPTNSVGGSLFRIKMKRREAAFFWLDHRPVRACPKTVGQKINTIDCRAFAAGLGRYRIGYLETEWSSRGLEHRWDVHLPRNRAAMVLRIAHARRQHHWRPFNLLVRNLTNQVVYTVQSS